MSRLVVFLFVLFGIGLGTIAKAGPGDLDVSFDADGKVTTSFGGGTRSYPMQPLIQSNGKIVVVGNVMVPTPSRIGIAKYLSNGSLDTSFGQGGKVITKRCDRVTALDGVLQASRGEEKIVAAGYCKSGSAFQFFIVRYNSNGNVDSTFGSNGYVTFAIPGLNSFIVDIEVQNNQSLVATGTLNTPEIGGNILTARFTPNGSLDPTFGNGGYVITDLPLSDENAYGIRVQPDGKMVIAGQTVENNNFLHALTRLNADGTTDFGFGNNGIVLVDPTSGDDDFSELALQPDGKILLSGMINTASGNDDFGIMRFNSDGSIDTSFGTQGIVTVDFFGQYDSGYASTIQGDGKILIAGWAGSQDTLQIRMRKKMNVFGLLRFETSDSESCVLSSVSQEKLM